MIDAVKNLINTLESNEDLLDDFYARQKSITKGHLMQMLDINKIDVNSKIRLKEKHKLRIAKNDTSLSIKFYDLKLNMPSAAESFLIALFKSDQPETIKKIDCTIDEESRVLMAQELSKIGVLEVS